MKVHTLTPIPMYTLRTTFHEVERNGKLVDLNHNLEDRWYENELQPILDETYRVNIVKRDREKRTGRARSLVHYEGYPDHQNKWYYDTDLEMI